MLTIIVILILLNVLVFAAKASISGAAKADAAPSASSPAAPEHCGDARRAIRYYVRVTNEWRSRMGAGVTRAGASRKGYVPIGSCPHVRHLAKVWHQRATASRRAYLRWWRERRSVIARLNRGLAGSPMADTGVSLEHWGRRFHVSPYFMAAAAATESSLGRAACSNNHYNAWGLASCNGSWYVPAFHSWDEAIAFYARFLATRWPGHSTPYSFVGYAACSPCWGAKTSSWMHSLFGVPAVTRYP